MPCAAALAAPSSIADPAPDSRSLLLVGLRQFFKNAFGECAFTDPAKQAFLGCFCAHTSAVAFLLQAKRVNVANAKTVPQVARHRTQWHQSRHQTQPGFQTVQA